MNFGAVDDINDDPGHFTGLFSMQDPVMNRRIMGIGRVNLVGKSVEFHPLGPAEGVGFAMAPDRKRAYGLFQQIGRYEFWSFDLEQKKLLNRTDLSYRYAITESPLPVKNYEAQFSITPDDDDEDEINIVWAATYDAEGKPDKDARGVIDGIFKAGLDNIKAMQAAAPGAKPDDDDDEKAK